MKRIVVCADGTWNFRDQVDDETRLRHATNVTKVARAIVPQARDGTVQLVVYHDGVGTHAGMDRVKGGAFGAGLVANMRELYRSICYNFVPGDELFFFGFSRGAFTVRTLAGFMKRFGILRKFDDFFVPDLFEAYQARRDVVSIMRDKKFRRLGTSRPAPPIRFLGVWDTVSALGWPGRLSRRANRKQHAFHDIALDFHVANAYQALAIDERRVPFEPILFQRPAGWTGALKQVWFAGVHCNCGGGYSPDGLANETLHWMVDKAESHGLQFDTDYLAYFRPCFNSRKHNSMKPYYRVLGKYVRPIGKQLADGESLHRSVLDRMADLQLAYGPHNVAAALKATPNFPIEDTQRIKRVRCKESQDKTNALR